MIYFIYTMASICIINLLIMAFITWKIGLEGVMDMFFVDTEEVTKDIPL